MPLAFLCSSLYFIFHLLPFSASSSSRLVSLSSPGVVCCAVLLFHLPSSVLLSPLLPFISFLSVLCRLTCVFVLFLVSMSAQGCKFAISGTTKCEEVVKFVWKIYINILINVCCISVHYLLDNWANRRQVFEDCPRHLRGSFCLLHSL